MKKKTKKYHNNYSNKNPAESRIQFRLFVLVFFWILGFGVVGAKLVLVQVIQHEKYAEVGKRVIKDRQEIPAQRGTIYDRNGEILAVDLVHYSLGIFPDKIENKISTAREISRITDTPLSETLSKIKSKDKFAYLAHRLRPHQAEDLRDLHSKGLVLEKKYSRYYPYRKNGAHVIGFCDLDNVAQYGIELEYDYHLRGLSGHAVYLRDAKGSLFPDLNYPVFNPIDGKDAVITLDIMLQSIVEEELEAAVKTHQALNGTAILMNVNTGEILALADYPGFDPNAYNKFPIKNFRNIAVSDQFEPGSTFKIVALSMALEQLKLDLNTSRIFCENGRYTIFKNTIHDHKKFGNLTVREIFENSSNIGTIKLARQFEAPVFYRYTRDFGFGTLTGIDLPAESPGILHRPDQFTRSSTCYMSIGYEVAATPLQIACAYAAVANGGKLLQPHVLKNIVDSDGQKILSHKPQVIRQVVSSATAQEMSSTLVGVVENGTGQNAKLPGISIAGKTGTAQKLDPVTNRHTSKYISSFVGFFPVEAPRFVLLVMVNEPKGQYYGSQVAAPAFRNIVQRIIGLPQSGDLASTQLEKHDPPNQGSEGEVLPNSEVKIFKENLADYEIINVSQKAASKRIKRPVVTASVKQSKSAGGVPEFIGLTIREALEKISKLNLIPDIEGHGVVIDQLPRPGAKLNPNTKIKLVCKPS
jgi:cell division protein FtsI (penicillin-binding protein 3)